MNPHQSLQAMTNAQLENLEATRALALSSVTATERLVTLNLEFVRSAFERLAQRTEAAPVDFDWQELVSRQNAELHAATEKTAAYLRGVYDLAMDMQMEVADLTSSPMEVFGDALAPLLDTLARGPSGSQTAAGAVRSALTNHRIAYENLLQSTRRTAEANVAAVNHAFQAMGGSATSKAARKAA